MRCLHPDTFSFFKFLHLASKWSRPLSVKLTEHHYKLSFVRFGNKSGTSLMDSFES